MIFTIPSIISAISGVTGLFNAGRKVVEAITGTPSAATNAQELQQEVEALPPEQQASWTEHMQLTIQMHQSENQRLSMEQGGDISQVLEKTDAETSSEIAKMRATTRPWVVRMMTHFILCPFYLAGTDIVQNLLVNWVARPLKWEVTPFNSFQYVFGNNSGDKVPGFLDNVATAANLLGIPVTQMATMYNEVVPMAATIIVTYMGLRHLDKRNEQGGSTDVIGSIGGAVNAVIKGIRGK